MTPASLQCFALLAINWCSGNDSLCWALIVEIVCVQVQQTGPLGLDCRLKTCSVAWAGK